MATRMFWAKACAFVMLYYVVKQAHVIKVSNVMQHPFPNQNVLICDILHMLLNHLLTLFQLYNIHLVSYVFTININNTNITIVIIVIMVMISVNVIAIVIISFIIIIIIIVTIIVFAIVIIISFMIMIIIMIIITGVWE